MNRKTVWMLLAAGLVLLAIWLALPVKICPWDFHNSLYGPIQMLVHGQTPYTFDTPYGPYPGVWWPQTLGAFAWFGLLSCSTAAKLWLAIEIGGFVWLIWLLNHRRWPAPWLLAASLLALFLFPPLWVHVLIGQFSMMFVLFMVISVYLPQGQRLAPLLLALGLAKPQLGILVYPGWLIYTWRHHGWRAALRLVLLTAACMAALTVVLFIFYPGWVADFLFITIDNLGKGWDLPTLFVQLPVLLGPAGLAIWAVVFIAAFVISAWMWFSQEKKTALIFSLALTPMVTTYSSSWDFMLMLPAFYALLFRLNSRWARLALLVGWVGVIGLQVAPRLAGDIPDASQWWVPPAVWAVYLVSLFIEHSGRLPLAKWLTARRLTTP